MAVPGMDGSKNTGLANLSIYQIFASVATTCPVSGKPLALETRLSKILLNEDWYNVDTNGVAQNDVGVEVDAFATWSLTKNLSYKIEAAYLFAGDAWKGAPYAQDASLDNDNAYFMRHTIELTF